LHLQPAGPTGAPDPAASVDLGAPPRPDVCAFLLDSLGGITIQDVAAPNLSALGRETEEFLAHVVGLGQEWTGGLEWSEYLWLSAGVMLVGGVYFARAARHSRAAPESRPPVTTAEEIT
jgi:hypothetical protein